MVQKTIETGNGFLKKFVLVGTIIIAVGVVVWGAATQFVSEKDLITYVENAENKYFSKEKGTQVSTVVENLVEKVVDVDTSYKMLGDQVVSMNLLLREVVITQRQILKTQQQILNKLE